MRTDDSFKEGERVLCLDDKNIKQQFLQGEAVV